ncbi:MAG: hypothetical protein QME64_08105 [bacterium]|nr:hypothetical protein [bacterium]
MNRIDWRIVLIILALTVISILINGYHFEYADQELYFAYLPVYTDENAYPASDLIMLGKQTGGNYYTYLWLILLPFFRLFGMQWTSFIVHFINIYLIFLAFYFLAKRLLVGGENFQLQHQKLVLGISVPILLALVLLVTKKFVAGVLMVTIEPYLHPRNIALVLLIFAIERFLTKKWTLAFCLAGLAANIHLLSAGIILFCFLVSIAKQSFLRKQESTLCTHPWIPAGAGMTAKWKPIFLSCFGFIFCSAPVWVWILFTASRSIPIEISTQLWLAILQYRNSYLFPQLWDRIGWFAFLAVLAMFSVGYYFTEPKNPAIKKVLGLIFGLLVLIGFGFIFSELFPIPWLLSFQPMRSIQFLIIISIILLVPYFSKLWETDWISKFWAIGLGIGIFLFEPRTILLFLIISTIYITLIPRMQKKIKWVFAIILVLTILVAIPLLWFRITSKIPHWISFAKGNQSFRQTFLNYVQLPGMTEPAAWQDVQLWAKENSNKDSIWLTPPYLSGFRLRSQRSTVVEWKDGAMSLFNPRYAVEWHQRLQDFGINLKTNYDLHPMIYHYHSLTEQELLQIATKYHAQYLVVEKPKIFPLPSLYSNSQFNVYVISTDYTDFLKTITQIQTF